MAKLTIGQVADAMAIKLNKRAGRRRPPTPAATRLLFHFLRMIETLAEDYPTMNFHVHVSGFDENGDVFWTPVFEDKAVLDSSAGGVLGSVYRFVESAGAMRAASAKRIPSMRATRRLSTEKGGVGAPSIDGAGSARRVPAKGGRCRGSDSLSQIERAGESGVTKRSSDLKTELPPASGAARPSSTTPPTSEGVHAEKDAEAEAAAAAAAVLDAALAEEEAETEADDDAAQALIRAVINTGGTVPAADGSVVGVAPSGKTATPCTVMGSAVSAATLAAPQAAALEDGLSLTSVRSGVPRSWRKQPDKSPIVERRPATIGVSAATMVLVERLLAIGNVRTHLRTLMPILGKAIADTLDMSVVGAKIRLEWWPRKDEKDVWALEVELPYELRAKVDKRTRKDAFARPVKVSLPHFFCPRNRVDTDVRLAHLVLMLQMEESARVAFDNFIKANSSTELSRPRTQTPASLTSLAPLRSAPRVPPSPAELAALQVVPLPPGATFFNTPLRPRDHVYKGSNPPTHLTRIAPSPLLAPLPPAALESCGSGRGKGPARMPKRVEPAALHPSAASGRTRTPKKAAPAALTTAEARTPATAATSAAASGAPAARARPSAVSSTSVAANVRPRHLLATALGQHAHHRRVSHVHRRHPSPPRRPHRRHCRSRHPRRRPCCHPR